MKTKRNKWWKRNHVDQWESRNHADFLFITVQGARVVRRLGNYHFTLVGTTPEILYQGKNYQDAKAFARNWVKRHSDKLG